MSLSIFNRGKEVPPDKLPVLNKTRSYILPCLVYHDAQLINILANCQFVATGLGDFLNTDMFEDDCIGYLVNGKQSHMNFDHPAIINTYPFGELLYDKYHMLVIKVPEKYKNAIKKLKAGLYSEMYENPHEIFGLDSSSKYYNSTKEKCLAVCSQDPDYMIQLADKLGLPENHFVNKELDSKIDLEEEFFNYVNY